jgi:hypothetical protein
MKRWSAIGLITSHRAFVGSNGELLQCKKFEPAMSALGQKQTSRRQAAMSALPPKADIGTQQRNVRFVPKDGVIGRRSCG